VCILAALPSLNAFIHIFSCTLKLFYIFCNIWLHYFYYLQDTVLELEFQGVKKKFTMLQVCGHFFFLVA